jgi:hypothetical protein
MSGYDDLVPEAMPCLVFEEISGSIGSSWEWGYYATDANGNPIDWAGVTGVCQLRRSIGGAVVIAPTVSFPGPGYIKVTAPPSETAAVTKGVCLLEVELTNAAGRVVKVSGAGKSHFTIEAEVTA